ncbi:MAG: hypothetical protein IT439_07835 [Phycisphaerales bacterium]|nr:hypothetical protein [Phycisphaerales bacterium]
MRICGALSLAVCAGVASAQTGTLDQVSPFFAPPGGQTAIFNVDAAFLVWDAQVRAGMSGTLEGVTLAMDQALGSATVRLRSGTAASPGSVLATQTITHTVAGVEFVFVDFTSAGLALNAGDTFVIELQGNGSGLWVDGTYVPPPAVPYYPEPLYLLGNPHADGNWRIGFETYMLTGGGGCPADLSGSSDPNDPGYGVPDGSADAADFFYYLDQFVAGNLAEADLTGSSDPNDPAYGTPDGLIDAADFFFYLDLFVQGC